MTIHIKRRRRPPLFLSTAWSVIRRGECLKSAELREKGEGILQGRNIFIGQEGETKFHFHRKTTLKTVAGFVYLMLFLPFICALPDTLSAPCLRFIGRLLWRFALCFAQCFTRCFIWRAFGVPRFFFAFDEALNILTVGKGDKQGDYGPKQSDGVLVG